MQVPVSTGPQAKSQRGTWTHTHFPEDRAPPTSAQPPTIAEKVSPVPRYNRRVSTGLLPRPRGPRRAHPGARSRRQRPPQKQESCHPRTGLGKHRQTLTSLPGPQSDAERAEGPQGLGPGPDPVPGSLRLPHPAQLPGPQEASHGIEQGLQCGKTRGQARPSSPVDRHLHRLRPPGRRSGLRGIHSRGAVAQMSSRG